MASKETLTIRLKHRRSALDAAYKAYEALLNGGVKSYAIGSRNLTRFDLPALEETIAKLEKEVDELEAVISGSGKRRRAVGVVPRDW